MTVVPKELLFRDVDGLAFASMRGKLSNSELGTTLIPNRIGPLLELFHLFLGGRLGHPHKLLSLNSATHFLEALEQQMEYWFASAYQDTGFIRAVRRDIDGDSRLTGFLMKAKRASQDIAGLSAVASGKMVAAMGELENNIHEHSEAPETGVLAYKAEPGAFEFVAVDCGIGVLHSLRRCAEFAALPDDGKALEAALTDGISRHGLRSNHGHGFRPIFTGLVNLRGELRFRSGDHALTMDGTSPTLAKSRITQKAPIDGFFACVRCHVAEY